MQIPELGKQKSTTNKNDIGHRAGVNGRRERRSVCVSPFYTHPQLLPTDPFSPISTTLGIWHELETRTNRHARATIDPGNGRRRDMKTKIMYSYYGPVHRRVNTRMTDLEGGVWTSYDEGRQGGPEVNRAGFAFHSPTDCIPHHTSTHITTHTHTYAYLMIIPFGHDMT
jgi:hypothetical protein